MSEGPCVRLEVLSQGDRLTRGSKGLDNQALRTAWGSVRPRKLTFLRKLPCRARRNLLHSITAVQQITKLGRTSLIRYRAACESAELLVLDLGKGLITVHFNYQGDAQDEKGGASYPESFPSRLRKLPGQGGNALEICPSLGVRVRAHAVSPPACRVCFCAAGLWP